jgi:hypothetical protein
VDSLEIRTPIYAAKGDDKALASIPLPAITPGKPLRISFFDNLKPNTEPLLDQIAHRLTRVRPVEIRRFAKNASARPAPPEMVEAGTRGADLVVLATCDCGSCTSWNIHDAVEVLKRGVPAVAVATEAFEGLARFEAESWGWDLPLALIQHPLAGVPTTELGPQAQAVVDFLLAHGSGRDVSGWPSGADDTHIPMLTTVPADPWEFFDFIQSRGWGDGLPVMVPTPERVGKLLASSGVAADTEVGRIPPADLDVRAEDVAVNAVLAGCGPDVFPIVLAAVRSALHKPFNLLGVLATTHPCAVAVIAGGPLADQVGMTGGASMYGPGNRANATIGRAVRLTLQNLGHAWPGSIDKATQGQPGKLSYCFAENIAQNPWEPYHVERGFAPEDTAVTAVAVEGPHNIYDPTSDTAEELVHIMTGSMVHAGHNNLYHQSELFLVLCPEHAAIFHRAGWSKDRLKEEIFARALLPASVLGRKAFDHIVARWSGKPSVDYETAQITVTAQAPQIHIVVAGGIGQHSSWLPNFGQSFTAIERVLPGLGPGRRGAALQPIGSSRRGHRVDPGSG